MRVGLFVTCLVDLMRPGVGFATLRLLEGAGCQVEVPRAQTCCGQPAWNSGDAPAAAALARKVIAEFEAYDYVVAPSGSCADHIRNEYPRILADDAAWAPRARALGARCHELTQFLADVLKVERLPGPPPGTVTYHDSCTGLRSLGIKGQPRALLQGIGARIEEMPGAEECCGFGGTFAIKFGDVSAAIAERKCQSIQASGAATIAGGDLGCLLNIEGKLRRMGDQTTRVVHIAELLAGGE